MSLHLTESPSAQVLAELRDLDLALDPTTTIRELHAIVARLLDRIAELEAELRVHTERPRRGIAALRR